MSHISLLAVTLLAVLCIGVQGASIFDAFSSSVDSLFTEQEEAPAKLVVKKSGYDERTYGPLKWVCAPQQPLQGSSKRQTETFLQLFSYLKGANTGETKLEMSTPVLIRYERKPQSKSPSVSACFFISSQYQASPPVPTNANLTIFETQPMTILTRKFGGFIDKPSEWLKEATSLVQVVTKNEEKVRRDLMFWAAFDSPVKFWNRRNEVWLVKKT